MLVVRCPKCKKTMRYQPIKQQPITDKKKVCVYCGSSFKIHSSISKSCIVREEDSNTTTALFHSVSQVKEFREKMS